MTEVYRFLHLSDIHIGQDMHNVKLHKDIRNEVIRDAKNVHDSIGPADSVFIVGDIAFSGKKEQYAEAEIWLKNLTDAAGCPDHAVYMVPGNHDIDRDECSEIAEALQNNLKSKTPEEISKHISMLINDPSEILIPKFENFLNFANGFNGFFESPQVPYWNKTIRNWGEDSIRVYGLNSAIFSDKKDKKKRLALGEHQFIFEREPGVHNVILLHHPLEWLADEEKIREYFESRARIWLFGHEHEFRITEDKTTDGFERVEIYAGATNPANDEEMDFRYNWIELSIETFSKTKCLKIIIWPRVWTSSTKFGPDTIGLKGKKSKEILIDIPKEEIAAIQNQTIPEPPPFPESGSGSEKQIDSRKQPILKIETEPIETQIISESDPRFTRLEFLFWKKIQRDERSQILVDLKILPETENEIIQTWMRHGLHLARKKEMLHDLWEKVMSCLPPEEQEGNPFLVKEE
jgi:calcineurin-like phosphoesterase family protein